MQWTMICALVLISWTGKMLQRGSLTMLRINTLLVHTEYGPIYDEDYYCLHYHVKNLFQSEKLLTLSQAGYRSVVSRRIIGVLKVEMIST